MACPREPPERLDDVRVPAGHVPGDLLEHGQRALAPTVVDRLCDLEPLTARVTADEVGVEQVADVGDHPVIAGLDRLVRPQAVDAAPDDRHLGADPRDQLLERSGMFGSSLSSAR